MNKIWFLFYNVPTRNSFWEISFLSQINFSYLNTIFYADMQSFSSEICLILEFWIISCVCQSIYVEFRYLSQIINVLGSISIFTLNTSAVENIFIFKNDLLRNNKPIFIEMIDILEITGWVKSYYHLKCDIGRNNWIFLVSCNGSKMNNYCFTLLHNHITEIELLLNRN